MRLRKGDFADETVFGDDPVAMAEHWVAEGARFLHIVDLDGAREGEPRNLAVIEAIADTVDIPVQAGGGIRTDEVAARIAGGPVARAVIGTNAVEDLDFLRRALDILGAERIVVAVDAEDGMVKTRGWQRRSDVEAADLVRRLEGVGVREILYTDISRDGMMQNVNLEAIHDLAERSNLEIIASGGVTGLDDLRDLLTLEPLGVTGVIAGRALYEGRFTVAEARAVLESREGAR
ncbi:MAG: HisA/HisF-related TIM barrel protein [Actinobacteria bacterium]|nr:HisA/HisF-related TIM barrel protein [Actinomycetota bacterium]